MHRTSEPIKFPKLGNISTEFVFLDDAKDGQPVLLLNFVVESNNGVTQPAQTYTPLRFSSTKGDEFGGSVPP